MEKFKLLVLGGGTAGWFTALFLKKVLPDAQITLVESKDLGIVGVGEATTPHIPQFLKYLDLDVEDIIIKTNGTIKNGIRFDNWNGDGENYFHSFNDNIIDWAIPGLYSGECDEYYVKLLINKKLPFEKYLYQHRLAQENKIDLKVAWAMHFDATAMANYLEEAGKQRGIDVIDGKVLTVSNDEDGNIKSIKLTDSREIFCDFVFDCSGFHRRIIGEHYKTPWITYSKWLPMKKGIPFWVPVEDSIRPYTQAIAMKYGWMWKIPLQHRIGSGYIFDSDYIDEHQALAEAEKYYGHELEIRKIIPFDPGRYKNVWIKNCMAVGLSSSFLEPLESTSLWITTIQLNTLKQFLNSLKNPDEHSIKTFNEYFVDVIDEAMNFIYLHYMTKRSDSDFWKNFRKNYPLPDKLENIKEQMQSANLRHFDCFNKTFPLASFLQVCNGLKVFEKSNNVYGQDNVVPGPEEYKNIIDCRIEKEAIDHKIFLTSLKQKDTVSEIDMFQKKGYVVVRNVIPEDIRDFLTQYALFDEMQNFDGEVEGELVPHAHHKHCDPAMEVVLLKLKSVIEEKTKLNLLPTYSYFRVYRNGQSLPVHTDREACEISSTLCLNYDYGADYAWPIIMENERIILNPGDMVIYRGIDLRHGRPLFNAPGVDAWHVQAFFHYVDAEGKYTNHIYDGRPGVGEKGRP